MHNCSVLYFTDYDNTDICNINAINISQFATKNEFNNFVANKIKTELVSVIIYDFMNLQSVYLVANMFFSTRVYKVKTVISFSNNLPPDFRDNIDFVVK